MAATVSSPHFGSLGLSMYSLLETSDGVTGTGQGRAGLQPHCRKKFPPPGSGEDRTFPVLNRGLGAPRSLNSQSK